MQVVQVVEFTQFWQYLLQEAQYLTPSFEIVKYVVAGQLHVPSLLLVAKGTQLVQLVALEHFPHPLEQAAQLLLESA